MIISFEIYGRDIGSIFVLCGREKRYFIELYGREKDDHFGTPR